MSTLKKARSGPAVITKLPVFTKTHPRPGVAPVEVTRPAPDKKEPEAVRHARRVCEIHERQREISNELFAMGERAKTLNLEAEQLEKENVELHHVLSSATAADGWRADLHGTRKG